MTTFQSVNAGLGLRDFPTEATTPTTPRAPITNATSPHPPPPPPTHGSEPNTPTRWSFSGMTAQRPLPTSPFSNSFQSQHSNSSDSRPSLLNRGSSHHSHRSMPSVDSQDMDIDESDEGEGASDGEEIDGETGRATKEKKGQRFFCTEYPPCNLSFTRSEHLARHIRKHTGERPFQCHCSRRFSRLDNLRQHAQTVHVNEEIPGDSLAATGTRFQRQIRTDRVRTPTGRSRASIASSQGSHTRGHSRNLSTSSIGSTSSTISRDDSRRRPPPLMMATDASRGSLRLDTRQETPPAQYGHSREPSGDISTPTSSTFSNAPNSPAFGSTYGSPMSAASRTASLWGQRSNSPTHNRRLSVPSSGNPFTSPHSNTYPPPYMSPMAPSNSSSLSNSIYGSPANPNYAFPRGETPAEIEYRRRTWHPSTYSSQPRPATSGLSYYQTPDAPRPAFAPQAVAAACQMQRLPGIETFDDMRKPSASPVRDHSPMQMDPAGRPPIYPGPQSMTGPNDRRGHASWDMSLHQNLTKLDIASGAPPKDQGWGQQTINEHEAIKPQFTSAPYHQPPQVIIHQEPKAPVPGPETSFLLPETPTRKKRMGWYAGPPPVAQQAPVPHRKSPEDSSSSEGVSTPSFSAAEYRPSIVHSNGYVESGNIGPAPVQAQMTFTSNHARGPSWPLPAEPLGGTQQQHNMQKDTEMTGLDALVAAATSENKVAVPGSH